MNPHFVKKILCINTRVKALNRIISCFMLSYREYSQFLAEYRNLNTKDTLYRSKFYMKPIY